MNDGDTVADTPNSADEPMCLQQFYEIRSQLYTVQDIDIVATRYGVSKQTIASIWHQHYRQHLKLYQPNVQPFIAKWEQGESLLSLSRSESLYLKPHRFPCPPSTFARFFLQSYATPPADYPETQRHYANLLVREPHRISDERLRREVVECALNDPVASPDKTISRQAAGTSFEDRLESMLNALGIPFRNEDALRQEGRIKTPDALLLVPFAVRGKIVQWIDSKAMFGDPDAHIDNERQFRDYANMFGPGLVIYWFNYVEPVSTSQDYVLCNGFPTDIVTLPRLIHPSVAELETTGPSSAFPALNETITAPIAQPSSADTASIGQSDVLRADGLLDDWLPPDALRTLDNDMHVSLGLSLLDHPISSTIAPTPGAAYSSIRPFTLTPHSSAAV